jgi:DNA repair protein RadD
VTCLEDIIAWPHQDYGRLTVIEQIEAGIRRICLTSPTGGGKSYIICKLILWAMERDWQTVLYTNRKMLLEQLGKDLNRHGIEHGVRAAGYHDDRHLPIQVSSIQTEVSRVYKSKAWGLHQANLVIIDEAHLQKADKACQLIDDHVKAGAFVVGVTATPLDLGHVYESLIVAGVTSELRKCGALVPCCHFGPDEPDCRKIKPQKSGEYSEADVRKVIMTPSIFSRVYDNWAKLNPDARPALLFAPGVGESVWFAEQFRAKGVRAAHIDGSECWIDGQYYKSSKNARDDIVAGSEDGTIKVVCNRFVLREGINMPWLYHGIFATVFGSLQSYLQSGGRLIRAFPGLEHVVLQDHGGNWWRHGSLNADRKWDLSHDARIVSGLREERLRAKEEPEPICCPQCKAIRAGGPTCPKCGYEAHKKSRMVVQHDGELKEHTGDIFKPRYRTMKADTVELWKKMYFRSKRAGMTFRQAEGLFFVENGYYPHRDLPLMPTVSIDWFRSVGDVPAQRLTS